MAQDGRKDGQKDGVTDGRPDMDKKYPSAFGEDKT